MHKELSLKEKLEKAYYMANKIYDLKESGVIKEFADPDNRIIGHADGIIYNSTIDIIEGKCSLKKSMEFDTGEYESIIDSDITEMEKILQINQTMKTETNSIYNNNHARINAIYLIAIELYKQKYNEKHIPFSWEMEDSILKHAEAIEEVLFCLR